MATSFFIIGISTVLLLVSILGVILYNLAKSVLTLVHVA